MAHEFLGKVLVAIALAATILGSSVLHAFPILPVQAFDGNLYAGSEGTNDVKRYDASTGAFIDNFAASPSTGLLNPDDIARGPDGNLYIFSAFTQEITRYNFTTGAFINRFVTAGSGGLSEFRGFTFGPDGNLYVSSRNDTASEGAVKKYSGITGAFIGNFVAATGNDRIIDPHGLTFGPDGNLYLVDSGIVKRYDGTTGAFIERFSEPTGSDAVGPLVFGPDGNLYASFFSGNVTKFNGTTGAIISTFVASVNGFPAIGLTFGPDGNLYLLNGIGDVRRYNVTTGTLDVFIPFHGGGLVGPRGLVFGPDNNLYLSSFGTGQIKRFNGTTGAFIDNFVQAGNTGLLRPTALTFGPDGNLYVINDGTDKLRRYNGTTGAFIDSFIHRPNNVADFIPFGLTFGPDGNLYVSNGGPFAGTPGVQRYNGTTGAFIDNFVANNTGGLIWPWDLTFGPDGNLYVADVGHVAGLSQVGHDVKRYNGTTGAFIDNFVGPDRIISPYGLAFGPDGNLYVSDSAGNAVKRFNGTTGAFIDNFVPLNSGGLRMPWDVAFGPDGNLYVSSGDSNEVKRYNGTTGAFIDNFVTAGSGGLKNPTGLTFAKGPPSPSLKRSITVDAVDLSGNPIQGVWTVIHLASSDGTILKTGFTPLTFTGESGTEYKVSVANYDGKIFQHWEDASINNARIISLSKDTVITATYDTGDSLRGFTSLTYTGTAEQPDLTVNAATTSSNETLYMWTVIDPQLSDTSAGTTTYKVYAGNYQNIVFERWNDGSTERIRTLTIGTATTITAYYKIMTMDTPG